MESRILLRNDCLVAIPDAILIADPGLLVPALNFPFLKDVSQNCFVFDVVNFEK